MAQIRKSSVKNYIEVPDNAIIEMAGKGLKTQTGNDDAPPKLTVNVGEGLDIDDGQVCLDLKKKDKHHRNQITLLKNVHYSTDEHSLVIEKVFVVYEVVKTWFGLMVDFQEVDTFTRTSKVDLPKGPKGDQGEPGLPGEKGDKGDKGEPCDCHCCKPHGGYGYGCMMDVPIRTASVGQPNFYRRG